jgi:hypothetical protein
LKVIREKKITYEGKPIKITDFSTQTLKARSAWSEVFQEFVENNFNPRILSTAKLSYKIDGRLKVFNDKLKLKQYMTTIQNSDSDSSIKSAAHTQILTQHKQLSDWNHHISILTLNSKGLDSPIKRNCLANSIKKEDPTICC